VTRPLLRHPLITRPETLHFVQGDIIVVILSAGHSASERSETGQRPFPSVNNVAPPRESHIGRTTTIELSSRANIVSAATCTNHPVSGASAGSATGDLRRLFHPLQGPARTTSRDVIASEQCERGDLRQSFKPLRFGAAVIIFGAGCFDLSEVSQGQQAAVSSRTNKMSMATCANHSSRCALGQPPLYPA